MASGHPSLPPMILSPSKTPKILNIPLTINLSNITKLSSTNYLTWSLQIQSLLEGYDLHHFIDGTHTPPPPTVTVTGVASPNPHTQPEASDRLIFSALLGAISVSLQPLIAAHTTSLMHGKP
ncbi:Retrovirus-related Pol polyprotein from transposon RE1 [Vitis vinifera]|uniref:Retrovirus-related Pol polyprotein from transposon RE1 n=1 Tax=Vitis vinifera TaxID=29760 RepID=A0A438IRW8_VITVI|nr:Retrovirus-related Pol polyprotein from transposon RE1 [Vitis vinifera]